MTGVQKCALPIYKESFEKLMTGISCSQIGRVTDNGELQIRGLSGGIIIRENIHKLKREWQAPLRTPFRSED